MNTRHKNWDDHVVDAEEVARGSGFQDLRDRIVQLADPQPGDVAVDVGSGTGLLTLDLASQVRHVWAVDISPGMTSYLETKAASAGLDNITVAVASAVSLPLVNESADLVVSNYCLHHLSDFDKRRAIDEIRRVLRPGGRVVFGDMMFSLTLTDARDRFVLTSKALAMLRKGPAGVVRLLKNVARVAIGTWEKPVRADWWQQELSRAGFEHVQVQVLGHEGGIASARLAPTPPGHAVLAPPLASAA